MAASSLCLSEQTRRMDLRRPAPHKHIDIAQRKPPLVDADMPVSVRERTDRVGHLP